MSPERQIYWTPVVAGLALAANGLAGAALTGSQAVLADGLFSLVYCLTGLFTVYVSKLLELPVSERYPYGYGAYEPLTNLIKALLVLVVVVFLIWDAVAKIASGGAELEFGGVIVFTFTSAGISICTAAFVWWRSRSVKTPLAQGELINWLIDAVSIIGVTMALSLAWYLQSRGLDRIARYVDPAVVLILVAMTFYPPFRLGKDSLLQLLQRSPTAEKRKPYDLMIADVLVPLKPAGLDIRITEMGRFTRISVVASFPRSFGLSLQRADRLRAELDQKLSSFDPLAQCEVIFTTRPENDAG